MTLQAVEQDQLPCWLTGTSSGKCQETGNRIVRVCHIRLDSLCKPVLQATSGAGRHRGWPRKCWMDNVMEWTSLPMPEMVTMASAEEKTERGSLLSRS